MLVDLVVHTHSISQPIPVTKKSQSLFTDYLIITLFEKNGTVRFLRFGSRCWKVHQYTGLNIYMQSIQRVQEVLRLSQKFSRSAKVGQMQYLFQAQN